MSIARTNRHDDPVAAFDEFVRANFGDVWRFVRRRVADTADADDVTAEVFATAWRRRDEAPPRDERRLWLFGVAHHTLRNHHRAGMRRERLHLRVVGQPPRTAEHVESDDTVWRVLASLDPADRDLLLMRAWDGLAVNDIAVVLGVSANAVSQRLAKARTRLAAALVAADEDDPADETPAGSGRHTDGPREIDAEHTDRRGTGHVADDPATAIGSDPEPAPRTTEENGHA